MSLRVDTETDKMLAKAGGGAPPAPKPEAPEPEAIYEKVEYVQKPSGNVIVEWKLVEGMRAPSMPRFMTKVQATVAMHPTRGEIKGSKNLVIDAGTIGEAFRLLSGGLLALTIKEIREEGKEQLTKPPPPSLEIAGPGTDALIERLRPQIGSGRRPR